MSDNNNSSYYSSIPEEAILLDNPIKFGEERKAVLDALKISIKERKINYRIGPITNLENPLKNIRINNFSIKIITTGIYADEIDIKLNEIEYRHFPPQLILLAQIDDEYDYVFFKGVLTAEEFSELVPKKIDKDSYFSLEVDNFKGGINRFFTFIQVLNPEFIKSLQEDNILNPLSNLRKKSAYLMAALTAGISILLGSNLSPTPKLASIESQQVAMISTLRGNQGEAVKKICLVTPEITYTSDQNINFSQIKVNKPLIYISSPSQKLSIIKNGSNVWESSDILGPIRWPIKGIQKGDNILLRIKPLNMPRGLETRIRLLPSDESFIDLDSIANRLKDNQNKWIREINKNVKTDKVLALSLLFSEFAPKSEKILNAKEEVVENTKCK